MTQQVEEHTQWQLEGSGPEAYERYLVPALMAPLAADLVDRAAVRPGDRVLDVACGTGIVARTAAARIGGDGSVTGVDRNEAMLATTQSAAARDGYAIQWRQGDVARLPFADGAFDVVLCQQAVQFFPDPSAALREMYRVLAPDGRLGVNVLRSIDHHPSYVVLADVLQRHAGDEAAEMMRSPFSAWSMQDLRDLVRSAGFADVRINLHILGMRYPSAAEFLRREAASSPLAGPLSALPAATAQTMVRELEQRLREYIDDDGIIYPMQTYVAVARRQ